MKIILLVEEQAPEEKRDVLDIIKTKLTTVSNKVIKRETVIPYLVETGKCRHSYGNLAQSQYSLCPTSTVFPVTSSPDSYPLAAVNYPTECADVLIDRDSTALVPITVTR